jgi:hypothetical protein
MPQVLKKLLVKDKESMTQEKIDKIAILYNKTKDPKYKDLWYKLIKEFANGRASTLDDDLRDERRGINNKNSDGVQPSSDST